MRFYLPLLLVSSYTHVYTCSFWCSLWPYTHTIPLCVYMAEWVPILKAVVGMAIGCRLGGETFQSGSLWGVSPPGWWPIVVSTTVKAADYTTSITWVCCWSVRPLYRYLVALYFKQCTWGVWIDDSCAAGVINVIHSVCGHISACVSMVNKLPFLTGPWDSHITY